MITVLAIGVSSNYAIYEEANIYYLIRKTSQRFEIEIIPQDELEATLYWSIEEIGFREFCAVNKTFESIEEFITYLTKSAEEGIANLIQFFPRRDDGDIEEDDTEITVPEYEVICAHIVEEQRSRAWNIRLLDITRHYATRLWNNLREF